MRKLKYPKRGHFLNSQAAAISSNVIFQGLRYMSMGEKIFKLSITMIFGLIFFAIIDNLFLSISLGHLLNFIVNGQGMVLGRYLKENHTLRKTEICNFLHFINSKINHYPIKDVLIFGSFCRGSMRSSSDLDIRIYHDTDFFSSLNAYYFAMSLRFIGLIKRFPIDVFCFSDVSFLDKMDKSETPFYMQGNSTVKQLYSGSSNYLSGIDKLIVS